MKCFWPRSVCSGAFCVAVSVVLCCERVIYVVRTLVLCCENVSFVSRGRIRKKFVVADNIYIMKFYKLYNLGFVSTCLETYVGI